MLFSKDTPISSSNTLWTVTHLTEAMDSLGTAEDSRPQPDHNLLGQVIVWTSDLSTAAWITASAVTHTDHSVYDYDIFSHWGKGNRKKEFKRTIRGTSFPSLKTFRVQMDMGKCNCR
jgi:hypothetical protein